MSNIAKVEGSVTVSITELDNLRGQISNLTVERNDLLEHAKEVKLSILVEEEWMSTKVVDDYDTYHNSGGARRFSGMPQKMVAVKEKRITSENVSYIGLSEVQQEIRQEEERRVKDKLFDLESRISRLQEAEKTLRRLQENTLREMREKQTEEVDKIQKENKERVEGLQKEIDTLNGVVQDKTKDEQIKDLQQQLEKLRLKKGFWGFIHS